MNPQPYRVHTCIHLQYHCNRGIFSNKTLFPFWIKHGSQTSIQLYPSQVWFHAENMWRTYNVRPKKKSSFQFKSANVSVMIWGFFSWSGLGTPIQHRSWMYWMTRLSHQWILVIPSGLGHIPGQQWQDSSGSSCERVEHEDSWVSGRMRSYFHTWIGHQTFLDFNPIESIRG